MTAHAPIYTYANNHMIAELQESASMSPDPFLLLGVGSGDETEFNVHVMAI